MINTVYYSHILFLSCMLEFFETFPGQVALLSVVGLLLFFAMHSKQKEGAGGIKNSFGSKGNSTPTLNAFTVDFTEMARLGKIDPIIGRHEEVIRLAQVLSRRNKNNAIIVGAPGVGKTAIVEGLAQRIIEKAVPETLNNKRVLALDVANLLSGTKYRGEFEERAKKLVQDITASNRSIILFVDEVHSVIQSQGSEGSLNFSDILKPALARGDLQMIGATTLAEYEKYIKTDPALERRFQLVQVDEPNEADTMEILQGLKDKYREYHKVEFTDAALAAAIRFSNEFVKNRTQPDKSIDAMDEAASMVRVSHIHKSIPLLLHQAAENAHPELAALWKKIQETDAQIIKQLPNSSPELIAQREKLEEELEQVGVLVVDASDVKAIIDEWTKS